MDWPSIPEADGQLRLSPSEGAPSETWRLTQMGSDVKASHLTVSLLLAGIVPPPFVEFSALKSGCHSANAFRWPPKVIDLLAFSLSLPDTRVLCCRRRYLACQKPLCIREVRYVTDRRDESLKNESARSSDDPLDNLGISHIQEMTCRYL